MLQGDKVRLRSLERADLPQICGFNNDVEVELAGGGDPPYPQSLARLQADFDAAAAKGGRDAASFVIEAGGHLIGHCALFHLDSVGQVAELGITIGDKEYWGKGYGRDAIGVLLGYGFRLLNLRRVWLKVHAANARAIGAYRACGFVQEGRLRRHVWSNGGYDDVILMGVLREEWEK